MANELTQLMDEFDKSMKDFMRDNRVQGDIPFPVEVSSVEMRMSMPRHTEHVGSWVSIRPVEDTKTYLGVYLGDFTLDCFFSYNLKTKVLTGLPHKNPAIWVPDLKRVVWGCGSWWGVIDSPEKLRKITDADIQNVWYVKALKDLTTEAKKTHEPDNDVQV